MNNIVFLQLYVLIFWVGFVCAISFFESWLKFRAPGITLPIGLRVGKKVFNALNGVEWGLFLVSLLLFLLDQFIYRLPMLAFIGSILIFQTFYLLPILNHRADKIIAGESLKSSWYHGGYILADVVKIISLSWLSIMVAKI